MFSAREIFHHRSLQTERHVQHKDDTHSQTHTITEKEGGGKKQQAGAYFTLRVNGNKIPWWMSADVFDTNSHFPICCLIEHDE